MRLTIPKLRTWHLLGIVAASAAFIATFQYRWSVEDPGYALVRRLRSLDARDRAKAASELVGHRPRERRAIAPLMEMLYDSDAQARGSAARALVSIINHKRKDEEEVNQLKAALAAVLGDRDPVARRAIAVSLSELQAEPKVFVPTLLGLVKDGDAEARAEVIGRLGLCARQYEPARAAVLAALRDPDLAVRLQAVHALDWCAQVFNRAPRPLLETIMPALMEAADDESPLVRSAAISTLGQLRILANIEVPRMIEALGDPDANVRFQAASSLSWGLSAKRSETLIPALGRALADVDARVRQASAQGLGRLGLDAEATLPMLRYALANDPEREVRTSADLAILVIEQAARRYRAAFEKAIAGLGDPDPDVRAQAADWLGGAGPRASEVIPALVVCLADREAYVRIASATALGQLGPGAAVAVPSLAKLAESDPDEGVRRAATLSRSILLGEGVSGRVP